MIDLKKSPEGSLLRWCLSEVKSNSLVNSQVSEILKEGWIDFPLDLNPI